MKHTDLYLTREPTHTLTHTHPLPSCLHDVFAQYGGWEEEEENHQGGAGMLSSLTDVIPSASDPPFTCCTFIVFD